MAQADIDDTLFATSAPLSLTQGFALFPSGAGPFTPGSTLSGISDQLEILNESDSCGYFNFDVGLSIGIFFGVAGPAFAMRMHARGQTQDNGLAWAAVSDDQEQAGVLFGAYLSLSFWMSFSVGISVWGFGWSDTLINDNLTYNYDLLGNLASEINSVLEDLGAASPLLVPVNVPIGADGVTMPSDTATAWGFLATTTNQMSDGSVTVTPGIDLYLDLAPDLPYIGELAAFITAIGGQLTFGPTLDISIPVDITVTGMTTDSNSYALASGLTPAELSDYQQTLANALQQTYVNLGWASPGAAAFLSQAQQAVAAGDSPSIVAWFTDCIQAANGTVPASPAPANPPVVPNAPSNALLFDGGPATGAGSVTDITVEMQHTVSLIATAGFSVDCGLDSFNYSNSWTIDLVSLLGLPSQAGPYDDQFTFTNGNTTAPALSQLRDAVDEVERRLVDVVFEPDLSA